MVRQYIYRTRLPEQPHSPIRRYEKHPQGPPSRPRFIFHHSHGPPQIGKVLDFARYAWQGQLPTNIRVKPKWFQVEEYNVPSVGDMIQYLIQTGLGAPMIPELMVTSNRVSTPHATTAPLKLIPPLIRSHFLYPMIYFHPL